MRIEVDDRAAAGDAGRGQLVEQALLAVEREDSLADVVALDERGERRIVVQREGGGVDPVLDEQECSKRIVGDDDLVGVPEKGCIEHRRLPDGDDLFLRPGGERDADQADRRPLLIQDWNDDSIPRASPDREIRPSVSQRA